MAEVYALRDEVKPFVRSYFGARRALVSRENLSLWEHFHNQGGWNKTHETGWFLCQTRLMLVQERGPDLWLAPMVTDRWLKGGDVVSVRNAPTRFGTVGYTIRPAADREIDRRGDPAARVCHRVGEDRAPGPSSRGKTDPRGHRFGTSSRRVQCGGPDHQSAAVDDAINRAH